MRDTTSRVTWLMAFMGAAVMALTFQLYRLTIEQSAAWRDEAQSNILRKLPSLGSRGQIFDSRGRALAISEPAFAAVLMDQSPETVARVLPKLALILSKGDGVRAAELAAEIQKQVDINTAAWLQFRPIIVASKLDQDVVAKLAEHQHELPGVVVVTESTRSYPYGKLAGSLIGYVGRLSETELEDPAFAEYEGQEMVGKSGLEKFYQHTLRGKPGSREVIIDPLGHPMGEAGQTPSAPGYDLHLSLDLDLQRAAEEALAKQIAWIKSQNDSHADPKRGALVVQDVRTGAILAMASIPTYDPNILVRGPSREEWDELQSQHGVFLNNAIQGFAPGSTYKMATGLAGMERGVVGPYETIPCSATYWKYTKPRNWNGDQGPTDLARALAISCNPYFYEVGDRLGIDRLAEFVGQLGFGQKTGIDLPDEDPGNNPTQASYGDRWYEGVITSVAIGQGDVEVTPLQLANYVSTIVNNGDRLRPYLVSEVRTSTGAVVKRTEPEKIGHVQADEQSWRRLKEGMRLAVTSYEGTAHLPFLDFPIPVAAKTGGAETGRGIPDALSVAYAPYDKPEIAVSVIIEGGANGNWAAPVIRRVMAHYFGISDTKLDKVPTYKN